MSIKKRNKRKLTDPDEGKSKLRRLVIQAHLFEVLEGKYIKRENGTPTDKKRLEFLNKEE